MANKKRLIDANEVIMETESIINFRKQHYMPTAEYEALLGYLKNRPTVDAVEVVHGYWYEHHGITVCSHCQAMFDTDLKMLQVPSTWKMPNYCPNCGAKMDGGNEDGQKAD